MAVYLRNICRDLGSIYVANIQALALVYSTRMDHIISKSVFPVSFTQNVTAEPNVILSVNYFSHCAASVHF